MTIRYINPLNTRIHHEDRQLERRDRECDLEANRYLRDQPRRRPAKPRRRKPINRRGFVGVVYDAYQGGELPPPVLIPRSRN
jgi:hypothetical protein